MGKYLMGLVLGVVSFVPNIASATDYGALRQRVVVRERVLDDHHDDVVVERVVRPRQRVVVRERVVRRGGQRVVVRERVVRRGDRQVIVQDRVFVRRPFFQFNF